MPIKTEKPPIIEDSDVYLLGRQRIGKSEGAGRTLALLLGGEGEWFDQDQISEASGWRHPKEEMGQLKRRVPHSTSYRIEERERKGKTEYRIIAKS